MVEMSGSAPLAAPQARSRLFYLGAGAVGTLIVVVLRLALASRVEFCGWRDACFYFTLARQLAAHHGFVLPFVWNYQVGNASLPSPALEYWRPGMSLILALPALFGAGVTLLSAAFLDTMATVLLSLSAAWLAWRTTADRAAALAAYLLCLSLAPLWTMPLTPDAALFYAVAVAWFLTLVAVERQSLGIELLGVAFVGVAYFIRNDAIVLGASLVALLARRVAVARSDNRRDEIRRAAVLCGAFLLALLPAHLLHFAVSGHAFNSAIDRVIFFGNVDDFRRYGSPADFATWSGAGIAALVKIRLAALFAAFRGVLLLCGQFSTVLVLFGAAIVVTRQRRDYGDRFIAPAVFFVALVASYAFVLPTITDHAVPRSATALLPTFAVLAVIAARSIASSRRMAVAVIAAAVLFSTLHGLSAAHGLLDSFHAIHARYRMEARMIEKGAVRGRPTIAMVEDPAPFTATTGIPSVPLPSNGVAAALQAIRRYGVTAVVCDEWQGGSALARALGAAKVTGIPETTDIVIAVPPISAAAQIGATASR